MLIKYKGHTSNLLSDLSIELHKTVNLKKGENILSNFFQRILTGASLEEQIQLISSLPSYIKPFCHYHKNSTTVTEGLFHPSKCTNTMQRTSKILEKYITEDKYSIINSFILQCTSNENSNGCNACMNKSK